MGPPQSTKGNDAIPIFYHYICKEQSQTYDLKQEAET
tara:strand:- start:367 stop:477 length:111 start_codon:yes stop_codon:yes gene_type:complete